MSRSIPAVRIILGLLGGFTLRILLILAEDMGYSCELSLTSVGKNAYACLFLYAEGSRIFESLIMSAALIVCTSHRFYQNTVSINLIMPAILIDFFFLENIISALWQGHVNLIFFFILLAT